MIRYFILCFIFSYTTACSSQDERYFQTHPRALHEAINQCPAKSPKQMDCNQLQKLALRMNEYVYDLRMSPQGFGKDILKLQQTIAEQERLIKDHPEVKDELSQNKHELKVRLAIVDWLEAPER